MARKKVQDLSVGAVVSVPIYEFAPYRSGWNGWIFAAGIIKARGTHKATGLPMVKVEFPNRGYKQKRHYLNGADAPMRADTSEKWFFLSAVFAFNDSNCKRNLEHPREYWCMGTYTENTEFLIDKGILQEYKEEQ